jgi:hypothetical protein
LGAFPAYFNLDTAWSEQMQPWTTGMIYLARYTSVAVGVLTTLMIYHLGRRAYGRETGIGAAVIFGLTFLPVREAHFAVNDAPVALGIVATLYICLKIIRHGQWPYYLWAGVALGLSVATKYSAALLVMPIGVAHLLSRRYAGWSQRISNGWLLLVTGLTSIVSYLLVSPYTFLEREEFWADFSENLESARVGFQGLDLDPAGGAVFYLKSLIWGFGWPLFVVFLMAVLFALWRRRRADLLLLTLPLLGFFYMQRQEMYFMRWLLPFLPPITVLAAETIRLGVRQVDRWMQGLTSPYQSPVTSRQMSVFFRQSTHHSPLILIVLLTLPSTYVAYQAGQIFGRFDTRSEALVWVRQNIPSGSSLAVELLSPPWGPPLAMPGLEVGPYDYAPVPDGGVAEIDLQQYHDWGVQYIIASSFHYARPLRDKDHQAQLAERMRSFDNQTELIAQFQPYKSEYTGFFYHDQVFGPANDTLYRRQSGPIIKVYLLP